AGHLIRGVPRPQPGNHLPAQLRVSTESAGLGPAALLRGHPAGDHGPIMGPPTVPGNVPGHHTRRPLDPLGDHLALELLGDPPGDLLPIGLGQHPALADHPVLLVDGVADDLHQDQLLRPVGIKRPCTGGLRPTLFGMVRQLLETRVARAGGSERAELLAGAAALAGPVLGLGGGGVGDSFAALHGLYWLVANLALGGPVVLAVDDLQWADEPSLRWL